MANLPPDIKPIADQLHEKYPNDLVCAFDPNTNGLLFSNGNFPDHLIQKVIKNILGDDRLPREIVIDSEKLILSTYFSDEKEIIICRTKDIVSIPKQNLYQNIFHLSKDIIAVIDYRGIFQIVNDSVEKILGYKNVEVEGFHYASFLHDDERSVDIRKLVSEELNYADQVGVETSFRHKNGEKVFLEWTVHHQIENKLFYCIGRDITPFKLKEKQVSEQRERVLKVLETIQDAFLFIGPDGKLVYINNRAQDLLNIPTRSVGKRIWEQIPKSKDSMLFQRFQEAFEKKSGAHFEFFNPDVNKWLEVTAHFSEFGLIVYFKDLSDKRKADEVMRVSYQRYKLLNRVTQDAIWDWDVANNVLFWNDNFKTVFGYQPSENRSFDQWSDNIHPEDRERVVESLRKTAEIANRDVWVEEYRFRKSSGEYMHILDQGFVMKNSSGEVVKMIGAMRDITPHKLNEENQVRLNRELLKRNQRLEEFTYITSHNLRGNLSNFMGLLQILNREELGGTENRMFVEKMDEAAQSMNETLSELLDVLVIQNDTEVKLERIHLPTLLKKVIGGLSFQITTTRGNVRTHFAEVEEINSNPVYLESILYNLISNALKYKSPRRIPEIDIHVVEGADYWEFKISDNGLGIDLSRHKNRLFGMYQRFHQSQSGKGLGLYLVKSQISALRGHIEVQSELGQGTSFIFTLPKNPSI